MPPEQEILIKSWSRPSTRRFLGGAVMIIVAAGLFFDSLDAPRGKYPAWIKVVAPILGLAGLVVAASRKTRISVAQSGAEIIVRGEWLTPKIRRFPIMNISLEVEAPMVRQSLEAGGSMARSGKGAHALVLAASGHNEKIMLDTDDPDEIRSDQHEMRARIWRNALALGVPQIVSRALGELDRTFTGSLHMPAGLDFERDETKTAINAILAGLGDEDRTTADKILRKLQDWIPYEQRQAQLDQGKDQAQASR